MAPFSLPVILGHLGLPVETFPEDLYDATSMTYKGRPHALHAGSDFVLQQVAHV